MQLKSSVFAFFYISPLILIFFLKIIKQQHYICIHIDIKSDEKFYDALKKVSNCFDNIFLAEKREDVIYTHFSMIKVSEFLKTLDFYSL